MSQATTEQERTGDGPPAPPVPGREGWARAAWALFLCEVAAIGVLVARPAGPFPVYVHYLVPPLLGAAAVLVGAWGMLTLVRRRGHSAPGRLGAMFALAFVLATVSYPVPFPARREARPSQVEFRLPLRGEWFVLWGGSAPETNLMARARADRRFGFDFVRRVDGRACEGEGRRPEDWFAFGAPVLAPAAGRVVAARDDHPDRVPGAPAAATSELGNHVVLEVAADEFLFLAGLRQGSVRVAPGERVEVGQELAQVGMSGGERYTPEPHLALHLQASPDPRWGQGIPLRFHGLAVDGVPVERAVPIGRALDAGAGALGQRVEQLDGDR